MSDALPVIICGATEAIGRGVIAGLKPELEVIHFIFNSTSGAAEIPSLLSASPLPSTASATNIGSQNYARLPAAVIVGSGYDNAEIQEMRDACAGKDMAQVPWLRPDLEKPTPPLGPAYGAALVKRIKELVVKLEEEEKMGMDGVHFY